MGICQTEARREAEFTASFTVNLKQLYDSYKRILEFLKVTQLFSQSSEELNLLIDTYLDNPKVVDKENLGLCSVDSAHKLHPLEFGTSKVNAEWLREACLRQNKFIKDFPVELLNFEECYKHYVEFLYMCSKSPESVIVPNKLADFMWHAHMQDNLKYKRDSMDMLHRVLNHIDDYTEEQMQMYSKRTQLARKQLLRAPNPRSNSFHDDENASYHNYAFINYGAGIGGGGYHPSDVEPLPQPDHHHHPHKDHDHHHNLHHFNDWHQNNNNNDSNNHNNDSNNHNNNSNTHHNNDYGGHSNDHNTHSACGGGGGHSACGGGNSACGGGGSSCGGGGGD